LIHIAELTGSGTLSREGTVKTAACKRMLKNLHRKATEEIAWNSKRPHGPVFERMMMLIVVVVDDLNLVHVGNLQCQLCILLSHIHSCRTCYNQLELKNLQFCHVGMILSRFLFFSKKCIFNLHFVCFGSSQQCS
jgi:hypothetical protein